MGDTERLRGLCSREREASGQESGIRPGELIEDPGHATGNHSIENLRLCDAVHEMGNLETYRSSAMSPSPGPYRFIFLPRPPQHSTHIRSIRPVQSSPATTSLNCLCVCGFRALGWRFPSTAAQSVDNFPHPVTSAPMRSTGNHARSLTFNEGRGLSRALGRRNLVPAAKP